MPLSVVLSAVMAFGVSMTSAGQTYLGRATVREDWATAKKDCETILGGKSAPRNHGKLATWSSNNDYNAIYEIRKEFDSTNAWVGMYDDNGWKMVDGATDVCSDCSGIDKWNPGEPNNPHGSELCAEMYDTGKLNNNVCSKGRGYICEWQPDLIRVHPTSDRLFVAVRDYVTWSEARDSCDKFGGHLATWSSNSGDYSAIQQAQKLAVSSVWVGMHDLNQDGKWEMVDGATADSIDWNPGEPNNHGSELCAEMYDTGKLNNNRCDAKKYYICEFGRWTHKFAVSGQTQDVLPQTPWVPADPVAVPRDFVIGTYSAQDLMVVALAVFLVINAVTLAVFCLRAKGTATVRYAKVVAVDSDEDSRLNA